MFGETETQYALFPNLRRAKRAKRMLEATDAAETRVITHPEDLTEATIPLRLTVARVGMIAGAAAVAALALVATLALFGGGVGPAGSMRSPVLTLSIVALLGATLGGLAGALSFSTEIRAQLERLRECLRRGQAAPAGQRPALLVHASARKLDSLLRRHGAVQTGKMT